MLQCCYLGLMLVYIVIVCIVFLALRDFGGRRFISTVLLLLLLFPLKISFWSVFRWTQRSITQRRVITPGPIF